jgi:hypothetical protein
MAQKHAPPKRTATPPPIMPRRGKRPGHKFIRRTGLHYWVATQVRKNPMGYPDLCIALPLGADDDALDALCQGHTANLERWIDAREREAAAGSPPEEYDARKVYDGSIKSACKIYQEHPRSKFNKVKGNTRRTYLSSLKLIENDEGHRQIRKLSVIDVDGFYDRWRTPAQFVDPKSGEQWSDGKERIDRAHDAVSMLKTVLNFCAALHLPSREQPHCKQIAEELAKWVFEKGGAREQELTYEYASAFIRTALELEAKGVLPPRRGLAMAIATAAMFELMGCRQKDVIGEHAKNQADLDKALKRGATAIPWDNGDVWVGYFTWDNVPGWIWRVKTSKSKYRHVAEFDLTKRSMLFPLLERVPFDERTGPIVKGEGGAAIRERSHRKWFRQIATAAGIPSDVWHYDARAGSAGEADNAGVDLRLIADGMGHAKTDMTLNYIRRRRAKHDAIAEQRNASRPRAKEAGEQ